MVQSPVQQGNIHGTDMGLTSLVHSAVQQGATQTPTLPQLQLSSPAQQTASPSFAVTQQQPSQQMETLSTLAGETFLAEPSNKNLDAVLQKLGFATKADAVSRVAGDGFNKTSDALADLGVSCASEVVLLQAQQVEDLSAIRLITRRKMVGLLSKVVTNGDRLRTAFEQYQAWLEKNLEMTGTGAAQLQCKYENMTFLCVQPCLASPQQPLAHLLYHWNGPCVILATCPVSQHIACLLCAAYSWGVFHYIAWT